MRKRKTWREKMNNPNLPKVVPRGAQTMLVPSPWEVDAYMRTVPKGSIATITQMREFLAAKYAVDVTCPLTTGIFVHLASEVAEEEAAAGKKQISPYWRIVRSDGSLNPKFPGGVERQAERLRAEGHRILGGKNRVPFRVVVPGERT